MFKVSRIVVPRSVSPCVAVREAHEMNNKNDDINHDDNNTGHIDACILVIILCCGRCCSYWSCS